MVTGESGQSGVDALFLVAEEAGPDNADVIHLRHLMEADTAPAQITRLITVIGNHALVRILSRVE